MKLFIFHRPVLILPVMKKFAYMNERYIYAYIYIAYSGMQNFSLQVT